MLTGSSRAMTISFVSYLISVRTETWLWIFPVLVAALAASIALAIIIFETFEKWYLKISTSSLGILVMVLLLSNLALINKDHMFSPPSLSVNTTNMTIDDAIQCNRDWSVNEQQLFYFPLCQYTALGDLLGICKYSQVGTELISLVNFVN